MAGNDYVEPMLNETDAYFPELYTAIGDSLAWIKYANATIREAKRLSGGKPVYPYIWPQYPSKPIPGTANYTEINYTFWKTQLQTIKDAGADGAVVWGGYEQNWNPDAGW